MSSGAGPAFKVYPAPAADGNLDPRSSRDLIFVIHSNGVLFEVRVPARFFRSPPPSQSQASSHGADQLSVARRASYGKEGGLGEPRGLYPLSCYVPELVGLPPVYSNHTPVRFPLCSIDYHSDWSVAVYEPAESGPVLAPRLIYANSRFAHVSADGGRHTVFDRSLSNRVSITGSQSHACFDASAKPGGVSLTLSALRVRLPLRVITGTRSGPDRHSCPYPPLDRSYPPSAGGDPLTLGSTPARAYYDELISCLYDRESIRLPRVLVALIAQYFTAPPPNRFLLLCEFFPETSPGAPRAAVDQSKTDSAATPPLQTIDWFRAQPLPFAIPTRPFTPEYVRASASAAPSGKSQCTPDGRYRTNFVSEASSYRGREGVSVCCIVDPSTGMVVARCEPKTVPSNLVDANGWISPDHSLVVARSRNPGRTSWNCITIVDRICADPTPIATAAPPVAAAPAAATNEFATANAAAAVSTGGGTGSGLPILPPHSFSDSATLFAGCLPAAAIQVVPWFSPDSRYLYYVTRTQMPNNPIVTAGPVFRTELNRLSITDWFGRLQRDVKPSDLVQSTPSGLRWVPANGTPPFAKLSAPASLASATLSPSGEADAKADSVEGGPVYVPDVPHLHFRGARVLARSRPLELVELPPPAPRASAVTDAKRGTAVVPAATATAALAFTAHQLKDQPKHARTGWRAQSIRIAIARAVYSVVARDNGTLLSIPRPPRPAVQSSAKRSAAAAAASGGEQPPPARSNAGLRVRARAPLHPNTTLRLQRIAEQQKRHRSQRPVTCSVAGIAPFRLTAPVCERLIAAVQSFVAKTERKEASSVKHVRCVAASTECGVYLCVEPALRVWCVVWLPASASPAAADFCVWRVNDSFSLRYAGVTAWTAEPLPQ